MIEWMNTQVEYWHWLVFGMILIVSEIFVTSFILMWFGLSAVVLAIILLVMPLGIELSCLSGCPLHCWISLPGSSLFAPNGRTKPWQAWGMKHWSGKSGWSSMPIMEKTEASWSSRPLYWGQDEWVFICTEVVEIGVRVQVLEVSGNSLIVKRHGAWAGKQLRTTLTKHRGNHNGRINCCWVFVVMVIVTVSMGFELFLRAPNTLYKGSESITPPSPPAWTSSSPTWILWPTKSPLRISYWIFLPRKWSPKTTPPYWQRGGVYQYCVSGKGRIRGWKTTGWLFRTWADGIAFHRWWAEVGWGAFPGTKSKPAWKNPFPMTLLIGALTWRQWKFRTSILPDHAGCDGGASCGRTSTQSDRHSRRRWEASSNSEADGRLEASKRDGKGPSGIGRCQSWSHWASDSGHWGQRVTHLLSAGWKVRRLIGKLAASNNAKNIIYPADLPETIKGMLKISDNPPKLIQGTQVPCALRGDT